jgi:hypothetical protein
MTSERYMGLFTYATPWESLSVAGRMVRVLRIVFGVALVVLLLCTGCIVACSSFHYQSFLQATGTFCALALVISFFVGFVARMLIWRPVRRPPFSLDGSPPPEPPLEGAPVPAPLHPSPHLVRAAAEPLPNVEDRNVQPVDDPNRLSDERAG